MKRMVNQIFPTMAEWEWTSSRTLPNKFQSPIRNSPWYENNVWNIQKTLRLIVPFDVISKTQHFLFSCQHNYEEFSALIFMAHAWCDKMFPRIINFGGEKNNTKEPPQSDPISFLSSSLPNKVGYHFSTLNGPHICTTYSIPQFCSFFYPSEMPHLSNILHDRISVSITSAVFLSHPKSVIFPIPEFLHYSLCHSISTVPKMSFVMVVSHVPTSRKVHPSQIDLTIAFWSLWTDGQ